ncbi:hypothetical protein EJ02DRAFT_103095 [Clathrospora elynae]|uniref:Uncharacterized protein n=1 Tax=Clathrospora elynae TaxID=706981 RepID=A0A6A5SUL2_9PLEO|nr:hypothetical protein EJ02DRAFT_103095 [Clathrospora elynae]
MALTAIEPGQISFWCFLFLLDLFPLFPTFVSALPASFISSIRFHRYFRLSSSSTHYFIRLFFAYVLYPSFLRFLVCICLMSLFPTVRFCYVGMLVRSFAGLNTTVTCDFYVSHQ